MIEITYTQILFALFAIVFSTIVLVDGLGFFKRKEGNRYIDLKLDEVALGFIIDRAMTLHAEIMGKRFHDLFAKSTETGSSSLKEALEKAGIKVEAVVGQTKRPDPLTFEPHLHGDVLRGRKRISRAGEKRKPSRLPSSASAEDRRLLKNRLKARQRRAALRAKAIA